MKDLTIIYLTVNQIPAEWADYHMKVLKEAIGDCPVVSISRIPMDFGTNLIQEPSDDKSNIFILLVRHDGKFNLLDLIRKSGKVRQTLKLEFVGRN